MYPSSTGQFQMQQPQAYPPSSVGYPAPQSQQYPSTSGMFPAPPGQYPTTQEEFDNFETMPLIDGALVAHLNQVRKDARERMIVKILIVIVLILAVTAIVLQIVR